MGVPVQKDIDIIRWVIRWNVLQAEFQSTSGNIHNQRSLEITVAISAHNDYARSDRPQLIKNCFCTNVPEMPDLISALRHLPNALGQPIVGVRENKHAPGFFGFCVRNHLAF